MVNANVFLDIQDKVVNFIFLAHQIVLPQKMEFANKMVSAYAMIIIMETHVKFL